MRVDEHTIHFDESPVFYRTADGSGLPVLYLHGIPTSSDDWVEFLARTGGIAPDLQGFGRSGKGGHLDYSLAGLTAFVERFLATMKIDAVKLVAHDWGAAVGLALATRHPERIERLVVMNAPPPFGDAFAWPRPIRLWRTQWVGEMLMGSTTRGMFARTLRQGSVRDDAWTETRIADAWHQFDQGTQRAILRLVRSPVAGLERMPDGTPALILWGEQDPWYPSAQADAYASRIPEARTERLPDAGHWPWLDRPDLVERVAAFLEE